MMALLSSCKEQDTILFGEETGVYLDQTSYPFSFNDHPGMEEYTIEIPVTVLGKVSDVDRTVAAELYVEEKEEGDEEEEDEDDMENTADPKLYQILGGTIPAGQTGGAIRIRLIYGEELEDGVYQFHVHIVPSDDFPDVSYRDHLILKVEVTAQQIRPANWDAYLWYYWGTYSTKWWKFIQEATGRTSIPYWPSGPDPETWWMSDGEFNALNTLVVRAFKAYNESHDEPLTHDDETEVKLGMFNNM